MYDKIVDAAAQLAKKNGYNMVIADDQTAKIVPTSTVDVKRFIAIKRMLYADPAHDMTQELITSMNNAWIAAGGKPAPPPPVPAKPNGG
jgi:Skp family chaperone for outer membrane proteins